MHSPRAAVTSNARLALQRLYDDCLRIIGDLRPSTPRRMMLAELGLLPLQVFWWRQALQSWNSLAGLRMPAGFVYYTVCLDNLSDAFQGGACNMTGLVAVCLQSVGFDMPHLWVVVPLLEIDSVVEALTARLQATGSCALFCPRMAPI